MTTKVDRFRVMAEKLRRDAESKLAPRDTNTQKRLAQARSSERDGMKFQRAADLIDAYCDARDNNLLPWELRSVTPTKNDFLNAVSYIGKSVSNGYHSYLVDSDKFANKSLIHTTLRSLTSVEVDPATAKEMSIRQAVDNLRHCDIPGFFPTPDQVIDTMLDMACIESHHRVLEPSAGLGSIADRIVALNRGIDIHCLEVNYSLCNILSLKGHKYTQGDFLEWNGAKTSPSLLFDRIVMNPPFERKQPSQHIHHAYNMLAPGGRLVALLPPNHLDQLSDLPYTNERLLDGAFNSRSAFRQTGVSVSMVVINK